DTRKTGELIMSAACIRTMTRYLLLALLLAGRVSQAQDAALVLDIPFNDFAFFGTAAAISGKMAVVSAPAVVPADTSGNPDQPFPYRGVVNVYATDNERTAWTLTAVLHAEDADPPDDSFGSGVALRGQQLIVASQGALRIYERHKQGFEETDKLDFDTGEIIPLLSTAPLLFEHGVLAFKVSQQAAGPAVLIYSVDNRGQA